MRLLLTSTGLSHPDTTQAFLELIARPPAETKVAFVPTAARSVEELHYVNESKKELLGLGINNIFDVDLKNTPADQVLSADILYVCGGNTFYLLNAVRQTGFDKTIKQFVDSDKLYLGVSAGTILVTPSIQIAAVEPFDPNDVGLTDLTGLNLVDFEISVHTPEIVSLENVEKYTQNHKTKLYAISDQTALKVVDNQVEVIGARQFQIFND